ARVDRERPRALRAAAVDVGEEAPQLDEKREGDEHADRRETAVAERLVREARRAERGRDEGEQEHRAGLGDAERNQAVRAVVAATLRDRPTVEQAHDGDERR